MELSKQHVEDEERKRSRLKKIGGPLVPLAVLAGKAKALLLVLRR